MDEWGWEHVEPWRQHRTTLPVGPFLCVLEGPTCGHQLRHAHAVEMAREGVPLPVIQRQLQHAHLGVTSTYLQGIDTTEIINTIHARRPPVIPASAGLRL
jgi:integrase